MFRDRHHNKPCIYCSRPMDRADFRLQPTRDHVWPQCRGAGQGIVVCCLTCNGIKGDMLPEVWETFMEAHPRWWTFSKYELRAIRRAAAGLPPVVRRPRRAVHITPKRQPVIVPPELIFT